MAISIRLNSADEQLIRNYAKLHNTSISDLFRQAVIERIEDEIDIRAYELAMEEFKKDPVTYSHEEVARMLGINE